MENKCDLEDAEYAPVWCIYSSAPTKIIRSQNSLLLVRPNLAA
jgi:hypothetical protein